MSNAVFYGLVLELYRQADYLLVRDITVAIIEELKKRLGHSTDILFSGLQIHPGNEVYKEAFEEPMKAAVLAYDKSNEYYYVYEPVRAELFRWIEHCYPILCQLGDDFDDHLREAPELGLTILKTMRNIQSSRFISPGHKARCMFCNQHIWFGRFKPATWKQGMFGIVADDKGHARYFCSRPSCFRKITIQSCFKGT